MIGEFIRRNHPRLCHEISIGSKETFFDRITLDSICDVNIRDLSGLVGRSHGMNLRDTFPYLMAKYFHGWKNPYDTKVVYLMVLIRIADYMQIQKNRAPINIYKIKDFKSIYSQLEWQTHNSIEYLTPNTDDPEKIYVHCKPENSNLFVKLKNLFDSIQNELDKSWAIIGEVYGATKYKTLGISYRRIVSNLDENDRSLPYIPKKINFTTAPSVLKLLIKPLYNNNPALGIRELLQNSLDACQERYSLQNEYKQHINISIEVESDNEYFFIIEDNGVGMEEDTLVNYYFQAGLSFRQSQEWIDTHTDSSKNSVLVRTGKFGIGALAVFLLGDEIELSTRSYKNKDNLGLHFNTSYSEEFIEVERVGGISVGTKIRIKLHPYLKDRIEQYDLKSEKLDWFLTYFASNSNINIKLDPSISDSFQIPNDSQVEPYFPIEKSVEWRTFSDGNLEYFWTFDDLIGSSTTMYQKYSKRPILTCNGFVIKNGYSIKESTYPWIQPRIAVIDKNAELDLSLDRNSVFNNEISNEIKLLKSIFEEIVSEILSFEFVDVNGLKRIKSCISYKSIEPISNHIYCGKKWYILNIPSTYNRLYINKNYIFWLFDDESNLSSVIREDSYYRIESIVKKDSDSSRKYFDDKETFQKHWYAPSNDSSTIKNLSGIKSYVNINEHENWKKTIPKKEIKQIVDRKLAINLEAAFGYLNKSRPDINIFNQKKGKAILNFPELVKHKESFLGIHECVFVYDESELLRKEYKLFSDFFVDLLNGELIIPYNFNNRKAKFQNAFDLLSEKIERNRLWLSC